MATSDHVDSNTYFQSTVSSRKRKKQEIENTQKKRPRKSGNTSHVWENGNGGMEGSPSGIHRAVNVDGDDANRATEGDTDAGNIVDDFDSDALPYLHRKKFRPTYAEMVELQESGVNIRRGKFSKAEESQILRNFKNYVNQYGGDYSEHFGVGIRERKESMEELRIRKELRERQFHERLAHGLPNRTLYSVYKCARYICNPNRSKERRNFTSDETDQIIGMKMDGASFIKIGEALNRTPESIRYRFRVTNRMQKKGPFNDVELLKLTMCVADVHSLDSLIEARYLTWRDINWGAVANMMEDRSATLCQFAWRKIIIPDTITISRAQLYFLCCLLQVYAQDDADVPWEELATAIGMLDKYLVQYFFRMRKKTMLDVKGIPIPHSLKKSARKMRKVLVTKKIECFWEFENDEESNICDIPGLDSKHNMSWD